MFARFTEPARQVIVLAQDESRSLGHGFIGTEHLLLGLLRDGAGIAARALGQLGVTLEGARAQVLHVDGIGEPEVAGQIPFTVGARRALEASLQQAVALGHNWIGTEQLAHPRPAAPTAGRDCAAQLRLPRLLPATGDRRAVRLPRCPRRHRLRCAAVGRVGA